MVGFALDVSKLGTKSNIARTRTRMLMYPQFNLILVTCLPRVLMGVYAKFIGTPIVGLRKKAIWVPKTLITNL
jgi:hypothetical protein